jgi:hypothetical protein
MKNFLFSRVALTKHYINAAFQKLYSAKQGSDETVMLLSIYIVTTCKSTDIADYNKRMFFWTRLRPKICAIVRKSEEYLTFNACLKARATVETVLCHDAKYNKVFKSAPKRQTTEKARKDKGKGKAHHNSAKGRIS